MEKIKENKGFDLSLIMMMTSFFILDAICMFFIAPNLIYMVLMMALVVCGTLLLFKFKPHLKEKKVKRVYGFSIVISSMVLNTIVDIIRVMCL